MKLFFDTKKKTMPQQVKRNEEDIETLKNKGFIVNPRGEYDATKTYHKYDLVSYDGDSYIFVSETDAVGIPVTNEDYWQLYTSGGLNIEIGTTETLPAGSNASVTNSGTSTDAVLNFGIPKGEKGDKGDKGDTGAQGEQGPKGDTGAQGPQGPQGPAGADGMQNPMTTAGAIIYGGSDGDPTSLPIGTAGQVLGVSANGLAPEWQNANDKKYMHIITFSQYTEQIILYTNFATTFNVSGLASYLYDNNLRKASKSIVTSGLAAGTSFLQKKTYIYASNSSSITRAYTQFNFAINNNAIEITTSNHTENVVSVTDTVIEI